MKSKFNRYSISSILPVLMLLIVSSCIEEGSDITGEGTNRFRINSSGGSYTALFDTPEGSNLKLMDIWRDAISEADLSKNATVEYELDNSVVEEYNEANPDDAYIVLSEGNFSIVGNSVSFAKGEFIKSVMVNLNASSIDLSKKHAIGMKLKNPSSGYDLGAETSRIIVEIVIKNKYDGRYQATGTMVDYANASLIGYYPLTWDLVTTGANQVTVYDVDYLGFPGHIIGVDGGGLSYYGSFGIVINFDLATDEITSVVNVYGQPSGNGRSAELDPSGDNVYEDGEIRVKYWMNQPAVITPHRCLFDEVLVYKGPR
jgi:hypothetical protein